VDGTARYTPHTVPASPTIPSSSITCSRPTLDVNQALRGPSGRRRKTNSPKVRPSFPAPASYLPEMPEPKVYEFSKHIGDLCATKGKDIFRLGAQLGIDPMELLQMINGKVAPTRAVISGVAKELHSNVSILTKLAAEIKA
jgi:hypothetical protein